MEQRTNLFDVNEFGAKGASLLRLQDCGYPVPAFQVIPVSFFQMNGSEKEMAEQIARFLQSFTAQFNADSRFAVRSSSVAEDGAEHSYAGQFTTLLNVVAESVPDAVLEVRASAGNERARAYANAKGSEVVQKMAVIIQEMIPATVAGVAFGINPLSHKNEIVINAVSGLGDKLVDGLETAITYTIAAGQIEGLEQPLLNAAQINTIGECMERLGQLLKGPQDIEFAFAGNDFYLLQARPITTKVEGERIVWDNSNIVESYPGLTLPLTFSFIEKMYEAVYRQFSLVLGVTKAKVARNVTTYASMLGLLNGRVYYNLNSWYRCLALLPGYHLNAGFMEQMMGVKDRPDIDVSDGPKAGKLKAWGEVLWAATRILGNLKHARKGRVQFIAAFDKIYNQYRGKDWAGRSLQELWADYSGFEQLMLKEWKAPLVNDFFAMIYFGLLKKQCEKYWPDQPDVPNQLIAASEDIITTEPLKRLPVLAAAMVRNATLKDACLQRSAEEVWQLLQEDAYAGVLHEINAYLEAWGGRAVAELKLETVTYTQAPERLISILQSYVANGIFTYTPNNDIAQQRQAAETMCLRTFKGAFFRKRWFLHVLKNARYFVSQRENLRYYRTRGFSMVRTMMLAIGEKLAHGGWIDSPRAVFYLTLQEVEALTRQAFPVKATIAQRKADYLLYADLPVPSRHTTYGPLPPMIIAATTAPATSSINLLQGIPCSQGTVRGIIHKVDHLTALQSLNGGVLATYATDPGYVVLFASARGILTERGSLLSHAAIVSREMGIPCIVGVDKLMQTLKDGDEIIMDGSTGVIKILGKA